MLVGKGKAEGAEDLFPLGKGEEFAPLAARKRREPHGKAGLLRGGKQAPVPLMEAVEPA